MKSTVQLGVLVKTVEQVVLREDKTRKFLLIQNQNAAANVLYVAFGKPAVADLTCYKIIGGGELKFDSNCPSDELHMVSSVAEGILATVISVSDSGE
jgi:hypothetical protein